MIKEILFNQKPDILLEKMLDKAAMHQRVIASNVANISTPGYQRLGVSFDEELIRAVKASNKLRVTNENHIPTPDWHNKLEPKVVKIENGYWNGINNVSIDEEMVELGKNQLDFTIAARIMNLRVTQLRTAIRGRR
ncbi:MAG: flagellar basal body rod protein FlgB [Candidatus Latescibacteria bacterium]|nr:flagellar basal body rod protein FlgB [Candidatus Latescibacterota bacterium]